MGRSVLVMLCTMMLLSGCANLALPEDGADSSGEGASSPAATEAGKVTVAKQGNGWKASRTEIGTTAFSAGSDVAADTVNGAISVKPGAKGDAHVTATLWAYGDSEQAARDRLATLRFDLSGPGVDAAVRATDNQWSNKGGSLVVKLPTTKVGDVEAGTTNGAISIEGLQARHVTLDTTNGGVACDMSAASLSIDTTNGGVDCTGTFDDIDIDTTNSAIVLDIQAAASGSWTLDSTNAAIRLTVTEDSKRGYDVEAETTNGQISFDFEDTQEVDSSSGYVQKSRHERTNGFSSRTIQTTISIDTTNGAIVAGS